MRWPVAASPPGRIVRPAGARMPVRPLLRIGLSATQKPVDAMARYLVGNEASRGACTIVDEGHGRARDLAIG